MTDTIILSVERMQRHFVIIGNRVYQEVFTLKRSSLRELNKCVRDPNYLVTIEIRKADEN